MVLGIPIQCQSAVFALDAASRHVRLLPVRPLRSTAHVAASITLHPSPPANGIILVSMQATCRVRRVTDVRASTGRGLEQVGVANKKRLTDFYVTSTAAVLRS